MALCPIHQVLDELEQAGIGPMEILEDQDHRASLGDPLEERPPCREQLLAFTGGHRLQAQETGQSWFDPSKLVRIGQPVGEGGAELTAGLIRRIAFGDARPLTDHLGQGPEADPFAV